MPAQTASSLYTARANLLEVECHLADLTSYSAAQRCMWQQHFAGRPRLSAAQSCIREQIRQGLERCVGSMWKGGPQGAAVFSRRQSRSALSNIPRPRCIQQHPYRQCSLGGSPHHLALSRHAHAPPPRPHQVPPAVRVLQHLQPAGAHPSTPFAARQGLTGFQMLIG